MAENKDALTRLIETTRENLWFIINQDLTRDEAVNLRAEISKPLGVLISKHDLSVENNIRRKLQRVKSREQK